MPDLKKTGEDMLMEWKVMVFYNKMTLTEFQIRKETINEYYRRLGLTTLKVIGWTSLKKIIKAKDPDMTIPESIRHAACRGKVKGINSYQKRKMRALEMQEEVLESDLKVDPLDQKDID